MKHFSFSLAMAMVVSLAIACSPQPTKKPKVSHKTFKNKTFKQWEAICDAVEKCPRDVVEGMSQTATTFDEYESTCYWTQQHTMTLLQEKVLKGMLRSAVSDRHFELIVKYAEEGTNSTIKKEARKRLKQLVAP